VVAHVARRYPRSRALLAAGWSLGANILLRYLGEDGSGTPLQAAVSMCNPFDLVRSNKVGAAVCAFAVLSREKGWASHVVNGAKQRTEPKASGGGTSV
jgi:predicted alpha/beta-fold hydrolase